MCVWVGGASTVVNETKQGKERYKVPRNQVSADGSHGSMNDHTTGGRIQQDLWSIA